MVHIHFGEGVLVLHFELGVTFDVMFIMGDLKSEAMFLYLLMPNSQRLAAQCLGTKQLPYQWQFLLNKNIRKTVPATSCFIDCWEVLFTVVSPFISYHIDLDLAIAQASCVISYIPL